MDEKAVDYCRRQVQTMNPKVAIVDHCDSEDFLYEDDSLRVVATIDVPEHVLPAE